MRRTLVYLTLSIIGDDNASDKNTHTPADHNRGISVYIICTPANESQPLYIFQNAQSGKRKSIIKEVVVKGNELSCGINK